MDDILANTMKMILCNKLCLIWIFVFLIGVQSKKHKLKLENENRRTIALTTFGFLQDSFLQINVSGFTTTLDKPPDTGLLGFTLNKLESSGMSYLENKQSRCLLQASDKLIGEENMAIIVFSMDFKHNLVRLQRMDSDVQNMTISTDQREEFGINLSRRKRSIDKLRDSYLMPQPRAKRQVTVNDAPKPGITVKIPAAASPSVEKPTGTSQPQTPVQPEASQSQQSKIQTNQSPTNKPMPGQSQKSEVQTDQSLAPKSDPSQLNKNQIKTDQSNAVKPKTVDSVTTKAGLVDASDSEEGMIGKSFAMDVDDQGRYSFMFVVYFDKKDQEGLYELYFHNCLNINGESPKTPVNFTIYMIEKNGDNYLSAGHIPLPMIYFVLCVVFFGMACVWLYILKKSTEEVFKLHYLMLSLVYIKALALLFHAVNFHFMATQGHHEEAIAIIYYITYLMRGILLFVTIVLIGAGWAFVKYILSDRDKKIFIIVIPLQVLANVAQIIIEETEEGESQFITWNEIFIIVDLLCCGAILFAVVWSILQEASQTDGKAAISLVRLKLFRHFYILIVCYIYFTRIIVYLLRIAVPFQYEWLDELFPELATLTFYMITGYKFRPATNNSYLQVSQDSDDEVEMDEVVTQSGALEGLTKVNVKYKGGNGNGDSTTSTTANKRESSHEYD